MENNKIIRLNTSTKILYSLFNFFAPISFITIGANTLNAYNIIGTLFSLLSIAIGLFCFISNLIKYNRFLYINDKTITICKGKINNPKVIQIIKTENLASEKISNNFIIKYENKKNSTFTYLFFYARNNLLRRTSCFYTSIKKSKYYTS